MPRELAKLGVRERPCPLHFVLSLGHFLALFVLNLKKGRLLLMGILGWQLFDSFWTWIWDMVTLPADTPEEKRRKVALTMAAVMVSIAGVVWSVMYAWFGLMISAVIPITYSIVVSISLIYFIVSKRLSQFLFTQLTLMLLLPFFLQWSLGGFSSSGVVMFWAILAPVGALLFQGVRQSVFWLIAYIGLTLFSIWLDPYLVEITPPLLLWVQNFFFGMNLIVVSSITFTILLYFVSNLQQEITKHQRTETLAIEANNDLTATVSELQRVNAQLEVEIIERKQIAAALEQAKHAAEMSNQAKDTLLAKVSHELRTPLGAVLGYSRLLIEGYYGPLTTKQSETLLDVIDSTDYLASMVNELLDQSQINAGKLILDSEFFDLREIFDQVQSKMRILAQDKQLTLTSSISPDIPETLYGHPTRIQQILINLVGNAIKFTEEGEVQVHFRKSNETHLEIQVSDTGPGIPENAQARIFEAFGQVDDSVTRAQGGTGLGLSIVKQLTNLMNGQITLESDVGQGSTFTVLLPLVVAQENQATI